MRYGLGIMWLTVAGFQAGMAATSDERVVAVILFTVASFSLGLSVWNFVEEVKGAKNA